MNNSKAKPFLVLALIFFVIILFIMYTKQNDNFVVDTGVNNFVIDTDVNDLVFPENLELDSSMYQYSQPSLPKERNYYECVSEECAGNTQDYNCLEKCKLMTFRKGMGTMDTKDWVCFPFAENEDAYYKCLSEVYADYRYP